MSPCECKRCKKQMRLSTCCLLYMNQAKVLVLLCHSLHVDDLMSFHPVIDNQTATPYLDVMDASP